MSIIRYIMRKEKQVAEVDKDNNVINYNSKAPFLIQKNMFNLWEKSRETDVNRTNLRALRRFLGLNPRDTKQALQQINYASLYDTFWVKDKGSLLIWEDVRFIDNPLFTHALKGDDVMQDTPFKSPEHSNIGSYEKGWKLEKNDYWYLYKQGTVEELWSEIFSSALLGYYLGDEVVRYWKAEENNYSVSCNFINQDKDECLEHYFSLGGDDIKERNVIKQFKHHNLENLIPDLYTMWYSDALIQNIDRHEFNFGIITSDEGVKFAPLYDFNLSMVAYRYPKDYKRYNDPLIEGFKELQVKPSFIVEKSVIQEVYNYILDEFGLKIKSTSDEISEFVLSAQELLS